MSNYSNTKATIAANVYTNANHEVTAAMVKAGINAVVDTLIAGGFLYKGVATTSTNPGTPDANIFYIATAAGTYTNLGGLVVNAGEVAVLKYNGSWTKEVTGAATSAKLTELEQKVGKFNLSVTESGYYIRCDAGVGNSVGSKISNGSYCYIKHAVSEGDKVKLTGIGANQGRLWCFADENNIILAVANASTSATNLELTAPADSAYVIINSTIVGLGDCTILPADSLEGEEAADVATLNASIAAVQGDVDALDDYVKGTYPAPTPTTYSKWYIDSAGRYQDIHISVPSSTYALAVFDVEGIENISINIPKTAGANSLAFDSVLPVSGQYAAAYQAIGGASPYSAVVANAGYKYLILAYDSASGVPTAVGQEKQGGLEQKVEKVEDDIEALTEKLYASAADVYKDEAEEAGDENYQTPGGSGLVHQAATDETFDTIGVGLRYYNSNESIHILVKKGVAVSNSGILLTDFYVKPSELPAGDLFYIKLASRVTLSAGEYLWVYSAASTNGVPFRVWSNNTPGTRIGMYYQGAINTTKYSTAMRLLIRKGDVLELQDEMVQLLKVPAPEIIAVDDLYAVNGIRQKFYYNTFIHTKESCFGNVLDGFSVDAKCSTATIGTADEDGFEIYGTTNGTYVVNFTLYDALRRAVATFAVNVHIGSAKDLTGKKILMVGDSWTDPSFYNPTQYPTGKGYSVAVAEMLEALGSDADFVGSKFAGDTDVYNEGRGGWAWTSYVGSSSPFYHNGAVDFAYYRSQIGLSAKFDYVTFQLGVNDCLGSRKATQADWQTTLNAISDLIDAVLDDSPSAKIIINPVGLDAPGQTGWPSLNGLAVSKEIYQANVFDLSRFVYELVTSRADFGTSVFMGQSYFGVNRWYGYGYIDGRSLFFKVDFDSMSAADIATLKGWDFKNTPKFLTTGWVEYHAEYYDKRGYVVCRCFRGYSNWNSRDQEFVGPRTFPDNTTPSSGTLTLSSGSGFPDIPFTACYMENNDIKSHYFMNATHPYDYGFRMLGNALAMQLALL